MNDFDLKLAFTTGDGEAALSIIDPGCSVCLQSYKNIKNNPEFLEKHQLKIVLYPIKNTNGELRFKNSEIIARYSLAVNKVSNTDDYSTKIINRIFTEFDENGTIYQSLFNNELDEIQAKSLLDKWLLEWGLNKDDLRQVQKLISSEEITKELENNSKIVEEQIKPKGIPTMIYDGARHTGLYKKD